MSGEINELATACGGDCNWFLVGLTDGKMTHTDGCWSGPAEVAQALYLRQQIHVGPQPDRWLAVHIREIEAMQWEVNQESVRLCQKMS